MNKITIGIGILIIALASLYVFSNRMRTEEPAAVSFVEMFRKTPGAVLLDVRRPSEFAAGHIDGAVSVDFENPTFISEIRKLNTASPYFVYCRSGNRSRQAIAIMRKEGFKNISELVGGIVSNMDTLTLVSAHTATSVVK